MLQHRDAQKEAHKSHTHNNHISCAFEKKTQKKKQVKDACYSLNYTQKFAITIHANMETNWISHVVNGHISGSKAFGHE